MAVARVRLGSGTSACPLTHIQLPPPPPLSPSRSSSLPVSLSLVTSASRPSCERYSLPSASYGTISRGDSGPHCSDSKPTASRSRAYDRAGGRVERRRPHRSSAARLWPRLGLALLAHLLLRSSLEEGRTAGVSKRLERPRERRRAGVARREEQHRRPHRHQRCVAVLRAGDGLADVSRTCHRPVHGVRRGREREREGGSVAGRAVGSWPGASARARPRTRRRRSPPGKRERRPQAVNGGKLHGREAARRGRREDGAVGRAVVRGAAASGAAEAAPAVGETGSGWE